MQWSLILISSESVVIERAVCFLNGGQRKLMKEPIRKPEPSQAITMEEKTLVVKQGME
jgi:hypothetical protein